jgi:hypothetical protein
MIVSKSGVMSAAPCSCIDDRKIELALAGAEAIEQVEGLAHHPVGARLGTIDLVDDDDRREAMHECLLRDEPGLRHRSVDGVHQQQHAVHHGQHPLDFAAEIRVSRRVDDVDAEVAPLDRRVLGEDRDSALALERIRVHHAIGHGLARIKRARLAQQLVDQRGLAVVDVRDDGDVAEILDHKVVSQRKRAAILQQLTAFPGPHVRSPKGHLTMAQRYRA